ncbi:CHASE2 domain-containing protein [Methylomonas montana]|uniref:CHASE2 domain-containing protein n=1 Tax=Methylomonas montana TaxID=3058963 RepID=UPI002659D7AA|nr:CHASE2 domain-containing protein [Methylomonas montana]WKJ92328.1 CHASE2 domain-containing protein [Methylomonas montana]
MAKRHLEKSLIVLLLVLLAIVLSYTDALWRFDRWIYDVQLKLLATPASQEIVIVEVDQKSLQQFGRWPWPRDIHARLLETLQPANPRAIALDFIFSEADQQHPESDARLGRALASGKPVVLPVIVEYNGNVLVQTLPLPEYTEHAVLGHANTDLDKDGISRSILLQLAVGNSRWPAMPLAIYALRHPEILAALPGLRFNAPNDGLLGDYRVWLPFFDPSTDFTRVSYADVLSGVVPNQFFENKYVLVGLTASGIERDLPAPLAIGNRPMTGVDFIAAGLDGLLKQTLWQPLPWIWQFLLSLTLAGAAIKTSTVFSPRWLPLSVLLLSMMILLFCLVLLHTSHYWFAPSASLAVLVASYPLRSWRHFEKLIQSLFAERKRAYITLNAIVDGVITTTSDGRIEYMNAAALNIISSKLSKAATQHIDNIFNVEIDGNTHKLSELIQQSIGNHGPLEFNHCRLSSSDQHLMNANLIISPLFGKKGRPIGSVLTINDIGERMIMAKMLLQKAQEQTVMRELINRTEQVSLAKSQFLSQMSHELRTPLNAIIGFSQLMQIDDPEHPLAETHLDSVNEIHKAGLHLLGLIDELLDLARIESGKISLNIASIALTELISDCQTLVAPLAQNKGLQLIVQNPLSPQFLLKVDPKRAKQILLNFLSNAVKYNRPNGSISLTTSQVGGNRVRIAVTDTGQGLAEQEQQLLFRSFERLGADHTDIEGTGIGLAITKQLAELMHGNVGVSSTPGVGSTFWVELMLDGEANLS